MDNRSIGVFDSGLGGLTAVKQIMKELPDEHIVYFGDTGRVPYGSRSPETILKYVRNDMRFLMSHNVKMIVIACGTASSVALPGIQDEFDVSIVGVVEAAVKEALHQTRNKRIGIIGTVGTIKSGSYETYIHSMDPEVKTFKRACPLFVPLVENGHLHTQVTELVIKEYLEDIKNQGVDTLILGCTHYPLLKDAIGEYMGAHVCLIDPGAQVAKYLKQQFVKDGICHGRTDADDDRYSYYVSDNIEGFTALGGAFLECEIKGQVAKIDIERY